jgi:iron(III) transport system substrate-binding protein
MPARISGLRFVGVLAALIASIMLAVPMTAVPAAAQGETERLTVYSGRSEGLMGALFARFTEETGIQLDVRYGGTAEMAATILEEGVNSPADVYIAQDAGALGALAAEGRLRRLPSDILERVPPQFVSASGNWVGISGRVRVLAYNTAQVSPDQLPASILGLTDPAWRGRVGWAPSNGSFQAHVTAMRVLLGEDATRDWLRGMLANDVRSYANNNAIVQALGVGEVDAGLVNHYYILAFARQTPGFPVAIHYFPAGDPGSLVNIAGAGILDTSRRPGLAQRLILYLLGEEAQRYFVETTNEYPLIASVEAGPDLVPLSQIEAPAIDLNTLDDLRGTLEMLRETGALP